MSMAEAEAQVVRRARVRRELLFQAAEALREGAYNRPLLHQITPIVDISGQEEANFDIGAVFAVEYMGHIYRIAMTEEGRAGEPISRRATNEPTSPGDEPLSGALGSRS